MIFNYPKSSFWLSVRQVSGKQAMFPSIPTQTSYKINKLLEFSEN